ncbi:TIGR00725 family protein [Candidatus Roizmanbacteria bacterium]|nr:TIGR00725 family protein [Candidatus Roizmanbacteria bacterium]
MKVKRKTIVGVMGPGDDATQSDMKTAYTLGKLIAENGWVLLNGGRNKGVMDAVSKGAKSAGGLTIGILPSDTGEIASEGVDVAILTGMGDARNTVNILTSDVVVVCGMNPGTASEVALAIKFNKPIILLQNDTITHTFFDKLSKGAVHTANSVADAIALIKSII